MYQPLHCTLFSATDKIHANMTLFLHVVVVVVIIRARIANLQLQAQVTYAQTLNRAFLSCS